MDDVRKSVGKIVAGDSMGTAWMLSSNRVCTAHHCVGDLAEGSEVRLIFPDVEVSGRIHSKYVNLDIALIEVDPEAHAIVPLEVIARPMVFGSAVSWTLHGFPDTESETIATSGLTLGGTVRNSNATRNDAPSIQLFCEEGGNVLPQEESAFAGISGSPVLVSARDSEDEFFVLAVLCFHPPGTDRILFCTPVDALLDEETDLAGDVSVRSWDAQKRFPIVVKEAEDRYRTNIDVELLKSVWQDGFTGFWCNLRADDSRLLTTAIERVIVHAPFVQMRKTTDVNVAGEKSWRSGCLSFANEWIPVAGQTPEKAVEKYNFVELDTTRVPKGGVVFDSVENLACHVQQLCDQWTLDGLRDQLLVVLDDPRSHLGYDIAADILSLVRNTWPKWRSELDGSSELLHHFLGQILSSDGAKSMEDSAAGVGPSTLESCVVPATVFTLALCVALPEEIQQPKGDVPGNLGDESLAGHACGVHTINNYNLGLVARKHKWRTAFVMLPQLTEPWEKHAVSQQRFDQEVESVEDTFRQEPKRSIVLPSDAELLQAIGSGLDDLKEVLRERCAALENHQDKYVEQAKNVDA